MVIGIALLTVLWAAISVLRWWAILRTLATRSRFAILPTTSFQPSTHRTEAFARQMVFAPHQVRNWVDRPALALRIHLTSSGEGRMRYCLEVAERSIPGLRGALSAYDEIQLEPLDLAGPNHQDDAHGDLA